MANNALSAIRSSLNTKLSEVTELKGGVYIGRTAQFSGFPACRAFLTGIRDELTDTNNNYRTYVLGIDIVQIIAINNVTKANSEAEFQDAVDAVIDKLNVQWQLGIGIEMSLVEAGAVREEETPQGLAITMSLTLLAKTLISLS